MSNTLSETARCAKKNHRCVLCGEKIAAGQVYHRRNGVSSGDFWTMKMHHNCWLYESSPGAVDADWYEDVWDPAFSKDMADQWVKDQQVALTKEGIELP